MSATREFFPRVRRTVIPRPAPRDEREVLGVAGTVRAAAATIYGSSWYHDPFHDLVEVWDGGPALCFKHLLPERDKYARENLYLRTWIAYRTSENANVNIRTFSGNHVTLPNAVNGALYDDPHASQWVTEDLTLNVNSIYRDERVWFQRVDWEWTSRETVYEDELPGAEACLARSPEQVAALYLDQELTVEVLRELLVRKLDEDRSFMARCLALLHAERFEDERSAVELFERLRQEGAPRVNREASTRTLVALRA